MFKRLLVPLDGSPQAMAVLPAARALARATQASVVLVRVVDHSRDLESASEALQRVADELARSGTNVETRMAEGDAGTRILETRAAVDADVVVMATHGRSGIQRAILGGVAQHVLGASPVPVLLLKPGGKRINAVTRLLVPVDGSPGGALALGAASALARASEADITVVQAVPPLPTWMYGAELGYASSEYLDPAWEEDSMAAAQAYVDGLAARMGKGGFNVHARALRGEVAATIDAVASELDVDLIVMSTHALTGPARALLGSVADEIVRTAQRPVLLMRRPREKDD